MEYKAEKQQFMARISCSNIEIENITSRLEEQKHNQMLIKLEELTKVLDYQEIEDEDNDKFNGKSEYKIREMCVNESIKEKSGDSISIAYIVEKILDFLEIENYIVYAYLNKEKENSIFEQEIEQENYDYNDEEIEDLEELEEIEERMLNMELYPSILNLYRYNGKFYAIDLAEAVKESNYISDNNVEYKDPFQIQIKEIEDIYEYAEVIEKIKDDGRTFEEYETQELFAFLYNTLQKQIDIDRDI